MNVESRTAHPRRRRRLSAALAVGVALGSSGILTLATWNDDEYASGALGTGSFDLQGSVDGTTWQSNPSIGTAAALAFPIDAQHLSPGGVVDAPFAVRLGANTSDDADVSTIASSAAGLDDVTYTLFTTSGFGCTTTAGTTIVPAGTPLNSASGAQQFALSAGAGSTPGAPVNLCFRVSAGNNLTPNQSEAAVWRFTATSKANQ